MNFYHPQHVEALPGYFTHIENGDIDAVKHWASSGQANVNHKPVLRDVGSRQASDGYEGERNIVYHIYHEKSPLVAACFAGRLDIVQLLVEHDADVNISVRSFHEPFDPHCCISAEEREEEANISQVTPLGAALISGHLDIATYLMDQGADITCITKYNKLYLKGEDGLSNEKNGRYTTLHLAIRWGAQSDFMVRLINGGVDLSYAGEFQLDYMDSTWCCCCVTGTFFLWIPCLISSLFSRACRGGVHGSLHYTAEQQAEELENNEALAIIRANLNQRHGKGNTPQPAGAAVSP